MVCAVCGADDGETVLRVEDPAGEESTGFRLLRCGDCGLGMTSPLLSVAELARYYPEDYWRNEDSAGDIAARPSLPAALERRFIFWRLARAARPLKRLCRPGARVLDVGCGTGDMVEVLQSLGYQGFGVEVAERAASSARERFGSRIVGGTLQDAPWSESSFDAATLFHVLEHLGDPRRTLDHLTRLVRPGGAILIEVPNIDSWGFRLFRTRWQPLLMPQHLFHYSPAPLRRLIEEYPFEVISIGHLSSRASRAAWVLSLWPGLQPQAFRTAERRGRPVLSRKVLYLVLQLLVSPIVWLSAAFGRGDIITVIARRRPPEVGPVAAHDAG